MNRKWQRRPYELNALRVVRRTRQLALYWARRCRKSTTLGAIALDEWQLQQDALEQLPQVVTEAAELNGKVNGKLTDHLAVWLTAHLMAAVRRLAAADLTDAARWKLLHEACAALVALRRGDQNAEELALDRERLLYLRDDLSQRYKRRLVAGLEAVAAFAEKAPPQVKAAWTAILDQVRTPMDDVEGTPDGPSSSDQIRVNPSQSDLIRVNPSESVKSYRSDDRFGPTMEAYGSRW